MSRQLILHVGHAKTGSTSIQYTLAAQRELLAKQGVIYPRTRRISHCHHALLPNFLETGRIERRMGNERDAVRRRAADEWTSVRAQATVAGAELVVLSSESLFRVFAPEEARRLKEMLGDITASVRALGYMRSPAARYLSAAQQRLKSRSRLRPIEPSDMLARIESFPTTLGIPLEVRVFDRATLRDGDVVADFLDWSGIGDLPVPEATREKNVSLSAEAMSVLQRLGPEDRPREKAAFLRHRALREAVRRADRLLPGATRPRLRPEIAELIARITPDLIPLRDRFGLIFPDVDYDVAGRGVEGGLRQPRDVAEICDFDAARRDALEAAVLSETRPLWRRLLGLGPARPTSN